jgi:glycosyltransferase involved in cell wall biosynthesis
MSGRGHLLRSAIRLFVEIMDQRPIILFLATEDWFFCSHRLFLAIEARNCGYRVVVVSRYHHQRAMLAGEGIETVDLRLSRKSLSAFSLLQETLRVAALYRRVRPDIVYHLALKPIVVGGLGARLSGQSRVVSSFAGLGYLFADESHPSLKLRAIRWLIYYAASSGPCLVENPEDGTSLKACGITRQRIEVLPGSGVNVCDFTPFSAPQAAPMRPVVMMASRLIWPKGVGVFVEAARLCMRLNPLAKFVLVGEPDYRNPDTVPLKKLSEWTHEGVVEWWGPRTDMSLVLRGADVFVLPTAYREGMPKVLLEAMACGVPCITTNTRGCREAVRHGQNGLLVPPNDSKALAEAILQLLSSVEVRRDMGKAGRTIAVAKYNEKDVCKRTMSLFEQLLRT